MPMIKENYRKVFEKFVPEASVDYCLDLWWHYKFEFKITKGRQTKLGDYRFHSQRKIHIISVNNDLNKYNFLITYIHEVAHLLVYEQHKHSVDPHGKEWKMQFKKLMLPILTSDVFPSDVLRPLALYLKNPKASSCSDQALMIALHKYEAKAEDVLLLSSLNEGDIFQFQNRKFEKVETRRTRILCKEVMTGKRYLISGIAKVSLSE